MLSDLELVYLWRQFSEECYCVHWIDVQPVSQKQFKDWLHGRCIDGADRALKKSERADLAAIREAYQSRLGEATGHRTSSPHKAGRTPQALKDSLRAKAVSVASAIRDGTATAELVRAFLREDIPPLDAEWPLPDESEIEPGKELAAEFKAASAFALIKGIGALMSDAPDTAGKAVDEYLDLRRHAEKAGLGSTIISPPGGGEPLDPAFQDPPVELYRMIYLECIEDPIKQWDAMVRFISEDSRAGLVAKKGDHNWSYR